MNQILSFVAKFIKKEETNKVLLKWNILAILHQIVCSFPRFSQLKHKSTAFDLMLTCYHFMNEGVFKLTWCE